jgi:hypothetical protein
VQQQQTVDLLVLLVQSAQQAQLALAQLVQQERLALLVLLQEQRA